MAFQDYRLQLSFFEQRWVGLRHFRELFNAPLFYLALQNTLAMSILGLIFGTLSALGFAILLNEMRFHLFKRFTQTVSYLPHFVSWVVVANIVTSLLSFNGPVNEILVSTNILDEPLHFMLRPDLFWWIVVFFFFWKSTGWNAIIYFAAMTGIDSQLYEAAEIDGANRFQCIRFITLPGISTTIFILLILSIGNLVNIGFEKQFLLGNSVTANKAWVIDRYALEFGINILRFSFGTAIGIFKSVVSIILLLLANYLVKRSGKGKLF
jgi:putative aldouronate transport system permease protein